MRTALEEWITETGDDFHQWNQLPISANDPK
jgi:hypothetical protein